MNLSIAHRSVILMCALVGSLSGCGGGGDTAATTSASTTATPAQSTASSPATTVSAPVTASTTVSPTKLGSTVISGVVSTGAPVMGANLRLMDANGAEVVMLDAAGVAYPAGKSVVQTLVADGSYRLSLASVNQALPLLVQVEGIDASGLPLVLHSTLAGSALPLIANVTPATDAVVAMVLGANPRDTWLAASSGAATAVAASGAIQTLGSASVMTAASDLLKTAVKANLTAAKITNTKTLDFFRDSSFIANKTGLDLALEGLRVQLVKTNVGLDQLELSNKFALRGAPEVQIDLATAKTELTKTKGGVPATAIVSTLKATTSPGMAAVNLSSGVPVLATLDDLTANFNKLIAESAVPSNKATFEALPSLASYTLQNGRTKSQLTDLLAANTLSNLQFGRFLLTGCADDPLPAKGCTRMSVSTLVTDHKGAVKAVFSDVASYMAVAPAKAPYPAVTTAQWLLVGNGLPTQFEVYPAAYAQFSALGGLLASSATQSNPLGGVIANFRGLDWSEPVNTTPIVAEVSVQGPSSYSLRFSDCKLTYLCANPQPSSVATAPIATQSVEDVLIKSPYLGWVGGIDTLAGAKFVASSSLGTQSAYLSTRVPVSVITTELPSLNILPTRASLESRVTTFNWSVWAAANPHMKMKSIRVVANSLSGITATNFDNLHLIGSNSLSVSGLGISAASTRYSLLLGAQDHLGKYHYSQFAVAD